MIQGTIIRVAGPVVDVKFTGGKLPALQEALTVTAEGTERTMEVTQHVNETTVRCIMLSASEGLGDPRGEVEMFPDAWTVFEQTAPIYMHGMIFGAMTESFCAEQSARMTAMDSATKSAKDMIHDLELEYNRSRQGSITQEITEIIGGAAAVQNQE